MAVKIKVVNMIPKSLSNESNHDREPNLTVNPASPAQIVGTAFTPDPAGSARAPIYVSYDGGETWVLNAIVPGSVPGSSIGTADITPRFSSRALYVGDIRVSDFKMDVARTLDAASPLPMSILEEKLPLSDQPFVEATTVQLGPDIGKDRVFVGNNDFLAVGGKTATVDRSLDALGGGAFTSLRIEVRPTGGQNGPSVRTATHRDGTVYAAYFGWRSLAAFPSITTDVVVARDDGWTAGPGPFSALLDPSDGLSGVRVVTGRTVIWNQMLAQQRTGSQLSVAVDPNDSSIVCVCWCDQQVGGYTLHVRRSSDRGLNWSPADLLMAERTTNPALAINKDGKIGILYQQLTGLPANQRWETHFRMTGDGIAWDDYVLSTTPANQPIAFNFLGDYAHLVTDGADFCGIFCANNTPDLANFPQGVKYQRDADFTTHTLIGSGGTSAVPVSIDPFFFRVTQEVPTGGEPQQPSEPCGVTLPNIPPECVSPAAPAWVPYSQCVFWYETRFVGQFPLIYRVIYQHCAKLLGRQQGPLLYTTTLLPGETLKLYHSDRYRRTRAVKDAFSVHTSWRQYVSVAHRSRSAESTSNYQKFLVDAVVDGDTNINVGGALFPVSWSSNDFDEAHIHDLRTASTDKVNEDFQETVAVATQQVDTQRSIVVSTFEDAEAIDVTSRTIKNDNNCTAVTYFVRRVNELYELSTRVFSIEWTLIDRQKTIAARGGGTALEWRRLDHLQGVDAKAREAIKLGVALLPKVGETVVADQMITLPTDGVVYEAELAHCSSCEPARMVAVQIELEKSKAEALKACCEAELCQLEVRRRTLQLQKGVLTPFTQG